MAVPREGQEGATRATWTVLGLLAVAFMAWAGVVWDRSNRLLTDLQMALQDVARAQERVDAMRRETGRHYELHWHSEAGEQIIELRGRMAGAERRILTLEHGRPNYAE